MLSAEWLYDKCAALGVTHNLWIGFSGGVDSRVLLELCNLAFNNTAYKIHAVHINHQLHKDSASWQEHCRKVCADYNIPFKAIAVNTAKDEESCRKARYISWQQLLTNKDTLLLAHHAGDQTETVLFRLCRGTGLQGLQGMAESTNLYGIKVVRPLLTVTKQSILTFARSNKFEWVEDSSNYELQFSRNILRHKVISTMEQYWPITDSVGKLVDNLQSSYRALQSLLDKELQACLADYNSLIISKVQKYELELQNEILRAWLVRQNYYPPGKLQLQKIHSDVLSARIDADPILNCGDYLIRRYRNNLYALANIKENRQVEQCKFVIVVKEHEQVVQLPYGNLVITKNNIDADCQIHLGKSSEITIYLGTHGTKAKKIFQKFAIPTWHRRRYPLIFVDDKLVAVLGIWTKTTEKNTNGMVVNLKMLGKKQSVFR